MLPEYRAQQECVRRVGVLVRVGVVRVGVGACERGGALVWLVHWRVGTCACP
jgi:hypothetical protein